MAEELSAVKHFSTLLIFTVSFQISAFLKMNAICLKRLPSFLYFSQCQCCCCHYHGEQERHANWVVSETPCFPFSPSSPPEAEAQPLQNGKRDHCRRWLSHVTLKHTIPNAYDCWGPDKCIQLAPQPLLRCSLVHSHSSLTEQVRTWDDPNLLNLCGSY